MGLGFYSGLVDQNSSVGVKPGEGDANVGIKKTKFRWGDPCILELQSRALLAPENYNVFALDTDSAIAYRYTAWMLGHSRRDDR